MLSPNLQWIANEFPNLSNLDEIAVGGQKLVLSAQHPTDGDIVLKLIHPSQDPEGTRREILAVSQISSHRVPQVLEVGNLLSPLGQLVWLREQRIVGLTLRERLQSGTLHVDEVLRLGTHILDVLSTSENFQIVHRDIKPENIMQDAAGNFWLLDFGIARHLAMTPLTPATLPFGRFTLGYAPPEQVRNVQTEIDCTADLFALGVTIYESSTGANPFRNGAADDFEILRRVDNMPLPPLLLPINNQQSFSDLICAITQKRRDHRPRTIAQAADWLAEIVAAQTP